MDVFEQFESKVMDFAKEHTFSLLLIWSIFVIITIMALAMTATTAPYAWNEAYKIVLSKGNATEIQSWDTLIIPLVTVLLNYQGFLTLAIAVGWVTVLIYVLIRNIYRYRNREKGEDIKPLNIN